MSTAKWSKRACPPCAREYVNLQSRQCYSWEHIKEQILERCHAMLPWMQKNLHCNEWSPHCCSCVGFLIQMLPCQAPALFYFLPGLDNNYFLKELQVVQDWWVLFFLNRMYLLCGQNFHFNLVGKDILLSHQRKEQYSSFICSCLRRPLLEIYFMFLTDMAGEPVLNL